MKSIINFYDNCQNRPYYKFSINLFLLKNNSYFMLKQLSFIHLFCNVKKLFKIKIFKFNYFFYSNFVTLVIFFNLFLQVIIFFFF